MRNMPTIGPDASLKEAIVAIDQGRMQIVLVVDTNEHLLGTITDGDVRRAILRGISLEDGIESVLNRKPKTGRPGQSRSEMLRVLRELNIHQLPLVDDEGKLVGLEGLDSLLEPVRQDNWVLLMAGGLGTRLMPLTEDLPKPLLDLGGKPILETILERFIEHGFHKFYISVNYKGELIEAHFGDGSKWGIAIEYLRESKRMGTAGSLALLPQAPELPLIVMNSDLLTGVDFRNLLHYHAERGAAATMAVREYDLQVPFGVVGIERDQIASIDEKPIHKFFVNAGIYVLEPTVLQYVPADKHFDMTELFTRIIAEGLQTAAFPLREYWLDIGRLDQLEKARAEIESGGL